MTFVAERLETLVVARAHAQLTRQTLSDLVKPLARFAPAELTAGAWRDRLAEVVAALRAEGVLDADHRARDGELERRIGRHAAKTWAELSDRVLPGLALGIAADDAKLRARLDGRDAWAAAIAARALGLWHDGPPPSLPALCDALIWRAHDLPGKPKRCPPELRAVFVQRHLGSDAGPPERLVRVLAAREVGAPRPELRALRDALVRGWLAGREPGASPAVPGPQHRTPPSSQGAATPDVPASFSAEVLRAAAEAATEGWFGDRKVFVSAVWDQLRTSPRWSGLGLAELKDRLLAAHRAGELTLARADLVAAMDPALVAASEIAADGASFHFIVVESPHGEDSPRGEPPT